MSITTIKIPTDKILHFIAGVIIYLLFCFISPFIGIMIVVLVAVLKEVHDYFVPNHTPDYNDAVVTIVGGLIPYTICLLL
jgi:VanZ family protein